MNSKLCLSLVCCMSIVVVLGCSKGGSDPYVFEPELPTWARTYGCYTSSNNLTSSARAGLQTVDRDYLVIGQSNWMGDPGGSWVLSLTNSGDVTWNRFIEGYRMLYPAALASGAYLLLGESIDNKNLVRLELSADGSTFSGQVFELSAEFWHLYSATSTKDGGTLLVSDLLLAEELYGQARVMKLSSAGAVVWERGYGSSTYKDINFMDVAQNSDGSHTIAGTVDISQSSGNANRFLVSQFDPNGGVSWARYYDDQRNKKEWAVAVQPTPDGGLVAVGSTEGDEATDILVLKLDKNSQLVWRKLIGTSGGEQALDVVVRPDGLIAVLGTIMDTQDEQQDIWLVALAPDGSIRWQRAFSLPGGPASTSIIMTDDGGFLISDSSKVGGTNGYAVLHVDGEGQIDDSACTMIRETNAQAVEAAASPVEVSLDIDADMRSSLSTISGMSEELDLYGLVDCGQGDPLGPEWGDATVGDSCDCSPANKCVGPQTGCELGLTCIGHYNDGGNPIGDCSHWCYTHASCPEGTTCHLLSINNVNMGMWCY
ncbi:MAG TPA: hypothetical protein VM425_15360 [Myxococcota bacterium]|nr:hypothetical protein [Myxococcota bacterium]